MSEARNGQLRRWIPGDWGEVAGLVFVGGVSVILALILIFTGGKILPAIAFVMVLAIFFMTFYRVDWGFYLFMAMVLIFDQFEIPGFNPITLQVHYFWNIKQIPYIPSIALGVMNPLEVQLGLMLLAWFLAVSLRRETRLEGVPNWGIGLLFFLALTASLAYGLKRGGDFLPSLWEVRALFYFGLVYFFIPQVIQTREQIRILMWIAIIAITFKALQGIARFVVLGFSFGPDTCLTNHEDPVFMATLFIFLIGLILFGVKDKQRTALLWLLGPLLLGFMAGQRRAAFGGFFASLITFIVILPKPKRAMLFKALVPILLSLAVYCAIFWNNEGRFGLPVQLVKSAIFDTDKAEAGERYSSNLYRRFEDYDLAVTIRNNPVIGIGFGNKYMQPIALPEIPFPLRDYISHNEILWLMVKMGGIGFFFFWLFMNSIVFQGAAIFRRLDDPYLMAICAIAIISVVNQVFVSYFDLQLTYYRDMIYLGTLTGLLPTIKRLNESKERVAIRFGELSKLQVEN